MGIQIKNLPFGRVTIALASALVLVNVGVIIAVFYHSEVYQAETTLATQNQTYTPQIQARAATFLSNEAKAEVEVEYMLESYSRNLALLKDGGKNNGAGGGSFKVSSGDLRSAIEKAEEELIPFKESLRKFWNTSKYIDSSYYVTEINENLTDSGLFIDTVDVQKEIAIDNPAFAENYSALLVQGQELSDLDQQITNRYLSLSTAEASAQTFWLWLGGGISIILFGLILLFIKRAWKRPLSEISDRLERISQGDYEQRVGLTGSSELGAIGKSINALALKYRKISKFVEAFRTGDLSYKEESFETDEQYNQDTFIQGLVETQAELKKTDEESDRRVWIQEGFTKFGEILQSTTDNIETLSSNIITNLVKHLEVNQGGIFVMLRDDDGNDLHLELMASYAFDREKFVKKQIKAGNGLLGATFLERKTTYVTKVPEGYSVVRSATGGADPKCILLVPMNANEDCLGVLELASFTEFSKYEIEFVEQLAENIGSTIANVRINARTRELYEQSRDQSAQMQAQEEEMRQNMEELHATQEEMTRKEKDYIKRIEELEQGLASETQE